MRYLGNHDVWNMSNTELLNTFLSVRTNSDDENYEVNSMTLRNEVLRRMGEDVGQARLQSMALRYDRDEDDKPTETIPKMFKVTIFINNYMPDSVYRKTLEGGIKRQLGEAKLMARGRDIKEFELVGYEQLSKGYYSEVYRQKFDKEGNPVA